MDADRLLWPAAVPKDCLPVEEISGIESAQRRMMVSEYIENLVEMQKLLYSKANAAQDNYLKRRVKSSAT